MSKTNFKSQLCVMDTSLLKKLTTTAKDGRLKVILMGHFGLMTQEEWDRINKRPQYQFNLVEFDEEVTDDQGVKKTVHRQQFEIGSDVIKQGLATKAIDIAAAGMSATEALKLLGL